MLATVALDQVHEVNMCVMDEEEVPPTWSVRLHTTAVPGSVRVYGLYEGRVCIFLGTIFAAD